MKKIVIVTGKSIDFTCLHIQRKETDLGVRTLCGRDITHEQLKPVRELSYDRFSLMGKTELRQLREVLVSNCNQCLRLESGVGFKRKQNVKIHQA